MPDDTKQTTVARFTRPMTLVEEWWNMCGWERWKQEPWAITIWFMKYV